MKALILAAAAAALSSATPASASTLVLGGSLAEACYQFAKQRSPTLEAMQTCDRAIDEEILTYDDRLATYVNRGIVLMLRNDFRNAGYDFDRAIAMDASKPDPWLNKGNLLFRSGRSADAIPLFDKAIELGTDRAEFAYYGRALANEDTGNLQSAYADLRRAVELSPSWQAPARELARYHVRRR